MSEMVGCPECCVPFVSPVPVKVWEGEPGLEGAVNITEFGDTVETYLLPGGGIAQGVTPLRIKALYMTCLNGHRFSITRHEWDSEKGHSYEGWTRVEDSD